MLICIQLGLFLQKLLHLLDQKVSENFAYGEEQQQL